MHVCVRVCGCVWMYVCVRVGRWVDACMDVCVRVCGACGCMCVCEWAGGWMHACMHVCVCVCVSHIALSMLFTFHKHIPLNWVSKTEELNVEEVKKLNQHNTELIKALL